MGKGGYRGGGTQFGPGDPGWFGTGGPGDGAPPPKPPVPLSAEAEQKIASLRRSIKALQNEIASKQSTLSGDKAKLKDILLKHGQPLDSGLE